MIYLFKLIQFLLKTASAFLLSIFILVQLIQRDPWVHHIIELQISSSFFSMIEDNVKINIRLKDLNVFSGYLIIESVFVENSDWSLLIEDLKINFSIPFFINNNYFGLDIICSKIKIFSLIKSYKLAIVKPIKQVLLAPNTALPFKLNYLGFKEILVLFQDQSSQNKIKFKLSTTLSFFNSCLISTVAITDSSIKLNNNYITKKVNGSARAIIPFYDFDKLSYKISLNSNIFNDVYDLTCDYSQQKGLLKLSNIDSSISCNLNYNKFNIFGNMLVNKKQFILNGYKNNNISNIRVESIEKKGLKAEVYFDSLKNIVKGTVQFSNKLLDSGSLRYNLDLNNKNLRLKYKINFSKYNLFLGAISVNGFQELLISGKFNNEDYNLKIDLEKLLLEDFKFVYQNKNLILAKNNVVYIDLLLFQKIFHAFGINIQTTGRIKCLLNLKERKIGFNLKDGIIKIGSNINFIKNIRFILGIQNIENIMNNLIIHLRNLEIVFYQGEIKAKQGNFIIDLYNKKLLWAYLPVEFTNLLINWDQIFLGILGGHLNVSYKNYNKLDSSVINGQLYLEKSKIEANILSYNFNNVTNSTNFNFSNNIVLDINFMTKTPTIVNTELSKLEAMSNFKIEGALQDHKLYGMINILNGTIKFPHKPVYVHNGIIKIQGLTLDKAEIYLNGKNKIKNYNINIFVSGFLNNPIIKLSSTPDLTDEKILSLLFSGSPDTSLALLMPNIFMQNLGKFAIGIDLLKSIFKPLKYICLSSDKIEVDLTDKLRAKITNKDLLSKDSKYELEYGISDDISLKAIKDELGSLGSEIEMRWKF